MELYIARHGETESNAAGRMQGGGVDTPLTPKGIAQAKALGETITGIDFDAIYSSPLKRAMDTARIAFNDEALFDNQGMTDKRLAEIGLGGAEGMVWDEEAAEVFPDAFPNLFIDPVSYIPPTHGESLHDMIARIDSFLQELACKPYKRVFVLAHGYVLKVVYACTVDKSLAAIKDTPRYDNCQLVRYTHNGINWEPI